jgi:hypothetical protein
MLPKRHADSALAFPELGWMGRAQGNTLREDEWAGSFSAMIMPSNINASPRRMGRAQRNPSIGMDNNAMGFGYCLYPSYNYLKVGRYGG